jgi:hypothetical protein
MKRWPLIIGGCGVVLALAAFSLRGQIRDRLEAAERPVLPPAQEFQHPEMTTSSVPTKPVATKPGKAPPVVATSTPSALPKSVNLAVPFLSQAPKMIWDRIHEDTCEEASIVMVEEFYAKAKTIDVDAGEADLLALVDKQMELYGRFESTSATETERLVKTVYGNPTQVQVVTSIDNVNGPLSYADIRACRARFATTNVKPMRRYNNYYLAMISPTASRYTAVLFTRAVLFFTS